MTGKGDTYRPVDWGKWSENYDRIFGERTIPLAEVKARLLEDPEVRSEYEALDGLCPACGCTMVETGSAPCLCDNCGCRVCEGSV